MPLYQPIQGGLQNKQYNNTNCNQNKATYKINAQQQNQPVTGEGSGEKERTQPGYTQELSKAKMKRRQFIDITVQNAEVPHAPDKQNNI